MTLTELRKHIYTVVEDVIKTGKTVEIQSKGKTVLLSPGRRGGKIDRLRKVARSRAIAGDPEGIIHLDWENEWRPRHI